MILHYCWATMSRLTRRPSPPKYDISLVEGDAILDIIFSISYTFHLYFARLISALPIKSVFVIYSTTLGLIEAP